MHARSPVSCPALPVGTLRVWSADRGRGRAGARSSRRMAARWPWRGFARSGVTHFGILLVSSVEGDTLRPREHSRGVHVAPRLLAS